METSTSSSSGRTGRAALQRLRALMNEEPGGRGPDWGNPLEKIEELLSCPICLDRFASAPHLFRSLFKPHFRWLQKLKTDDLNLKTLFCRFKSPRLLPCQHSFCCECLDAGPADPLRRILKCPECRAEHRFTGDGAKSFPANLTLQVPRPTHKSCLRASDL